MENFDTKNGFKIPEGYFENVPERILHKISGSVTEKQNEGFTVPSGYFENLDERIFQNIITIETKVVSLNPYRKYYYVAASIAAVVLLVFGITYNRGGDLAFDFEDLAFSEIEAYFETNEFGFTSYEIAEMIPVDQLEINDVLTNKLQEENILDYLNNNTDDFEELNLENND